MQIFVLRHGEAVSVASSDSERPLTDRGRRETLSVLAAREAELSQVQQVWVSPYLRAQQTAGVARTVLPDVEHRTVDQLTPGGDLRRIARLLEKVDVETIMLVSHQPFVGSFVDWLAGLEPGYHRLSTSALAFLNTDFLAAGCGHLEWLDYPQSSQAAYAQL